jgi:outer membrane protein assembly factor BamD (BamD/ComL family)
MQTKYSTLLLLALLSVGASAGALAQSEDRRTEATAGTPRLEELQEKGSEALFNLDYDIARQRFREMARLYPDDPTGPQMLATTLWLQTLNQARRLQAAIYSTQSFYAGAADKPDPRVVQDFRAPGNATCES